MTEELLPYYDRELAFLRRVGERFELRAGQFEAPELFEAGGLVGGDEPARFDRLELHRIGAGLGSRQHHLAGDLHIAFVIVAHLGDDHHRRRQVMLRDMNGLAGSSGHGDGKYGWPSRA